MDSVVTSLLDMGFDYDDCQEALKVQYVLNTSKFVINVSF